MFPGARAVAFFTILWFQATLALSHMKTTAHRGGGGGDFSACKKSVAAGTAAGYCLSWRTGVETYNVRAWPTVPARCQLHVRDYMTCGQYRQDIKLVTDQIFAYIGSIVPADDGMDAWIFDVDETCLSNLPYYQYSKRFGTALYRGMNATSYKSQIRRRLVEEGQRIWGNVGDQWSDLLGDYVGNRTFKIPNPMYFVP